MCQGAAPDPDKPTESAQEGEAADGSTKGASLGLLTQSGGLAGPGGVGPRGPGSLAGGLKNGRRVTPLGDLRRQSEASFLSMSHPRSGSTGALKGPGGSQGSLANASVDDLLKMWEVNGDSASHSHANHEEVMLMKHLELSAWYTGEARSRPAGRPGQPGQPGRGETPSIRAASQMTRAAATTRTLSRGFDVGMWRTKSEIRYAPGVTKG